MEPKRQFRLQLDETVFKGREIKMRVRGAARRKSVRLRG
jgi:hypothetical protein